MESNDTPIERLLSHNVKARDVEKLKNLGFSTCSQLHLLGKKDFTKLKGFSSKKAKKIWEVIQFLLHPQEHPKTSTPSSSERTASPLPPPPPAAPSPARPIPDCSLPEHTEGRRATRERRRAKSWRMLAWSEENVDA